MPDSIFDNYGIVILILLNGKDRVPEYPEVRTLIIVNGI
jgi:hypothetical protein